jgi:CBS domain-containing protein
LWLAFIGWFLNNAALTSYRQLVMQETLQDVPVRRLMLGEFVTVSPAMTVAELVNERLLPGPQRACPVLDDGRLAGIVTLRDVQKINRAAWMTTTVAEIMTPAARLVTAKPADDAFEALVRLGRADVNQLPVLDNGRLRGLLRREDLINWLTLYGVHSLAAGAPR